MKRIVLSLALAAISVQALALGERPGSIAAGTDQIARAEYDAVGVRYACALPKFTAKQYAIKASFGTYYTLVGEAFAKSNRTVFDRNASLMGKVISDLGLPC